MNKELTLSNESPELLPCPFCGGEAHISTYMDESIWSHATVPYTKVECGGCEMGTPYRCEGWAPTAPEEWNQRAIPAWRGYALLGTGQYVINHTPAPMDPELGAELIISIATEADKAGNRQVGEERDTDPNAGPIMPEQMAVRIGFLSAAALDVLEAQLRHLRRENFPETVPAAELDRTQESAHD